MPVLAFIGDIHGCLNTLEQLYNELLHHVFPDSIYSVGDIVDRGKDSACVIQFCIDKKITVVRGNHEQMLLDALQCFAPQQGPPMVVEPITFDTTINRQSQQSAAPLAITTPILDPNAIIEAQYRFLNAGGNATMASYGINPDDERAFEALYQTMMNRQHLSFINQMKPYMVMEELFLSHAGLDIDFDYSQINWTRKPLAQLPKLQIVGHTPYLQPQYQPQHYLKIDTGCVFGNCLTAALVDSQSQTVLDFIAIPTHPNDKRT
jgi:hypothetical protein